LFNALIFNLFMFLAWFVLRASAADLILPLPSRKEPTMDISIELDSNIVHTGEHA
jgi:hypothetical protein